MLAKRLKKGGTIGIASPSTPFVEKDEAIVDQAKAWLDAQGFEVKEGKNLRKRDRFKVAGGTPEERADDINSFFKDPDVNAIWCIWGGKPGNQVLDFLDYQAIKRNPKIFMGMSDIDVLHYAINKKTGLVTFNAPDFRLMNNLFLDNPYSQRMFRERLVEGRIGPITPSKQRRCIRKGKARGKILGCTLPVLLKLAGTRYFPYFKDSILFLEAYLEPPAEIVQNLTHLDQIGIFKRISGIVIGYTYSFDEPEAKKDKGGILFEDIALELTKSYSFPILKTYEFGHRCGNAFLPIGGEAEMDAEKLSIMITKKCLL